MESFNKQLGANIKAIRTRKGYSQKDVAKAVGVTKQTISKIEKYGNTSQQTLERIADALYVEDIREFYEPKPKSSLSTHYKNLYMENELENLFTQHIRPMAKQLNDIAARSLYIGIREYRPGTEDVKSILESAKKGSANGFSEKELQQIADGFSKRLLERVQDFLIDRDDPCPEEE